MMRSHVNSGWSAATQVKVVSPDIFIIAMGQGLLCPEASIVAGVRRRVSNGMPGSQAAAGHPIPTCRDIGTWESRIACMLQSRHVGKEARRGRGDAAFGPVHSRGVAGIMPGGVPRIADSLEGAGSQSYRAEEVRAIHRNG